MIFRLLLVILFGVIVSCSSESESESQEKVVKNYLRLLSEGKCDKAYELTLEYENDIPQDSTELECDKFHMDIKTCSCKTDGETAYCFVKYQTSIQSQSENYNLKKVDGEWLISLANNDK
ncbi:hypothetical protein K6119_08050 [Paracrocinitomix mangrovi]|uniref:hypothetical protein n=1 Tax=Paracrocinitomix mangrovi TaxID=2862509 RepID=UPI001C8E98AB|nr:hypothetical protein [Paracrocinitomix mangrovi]UKN03464.1 hypothetical protein K6119_08050 [Paracrocinitomix mangrovi]